MITTAELHRIAEKDSLRFDQAEKDIADNLYYEGNELYRKQDNFQDALRWPGLRN
jgi:hypothetical protein